MANQTFYSGFIKRANEQGLTKVQADRLYKLAFNFAQAGQGMDDGLSHIKQYFSSMFQNRPGVHPMGTPNLQQPGAIQQTGMMKQPGAPGGPGGQPGGMDENTLVSEFRKMFHSQPHPSQMMPSMPPANPQPMQPPGGIKPPMPGSPQHGMASQSQHSGMM